MNCRTILSFEDTLIPPGRWRQRLKESLEIAGAQTMRRNLKNSLLRNFGRNSVRENSSNFFAWSALQRFPTTLSSVDANGQEESACPRKIKLFGSSLKALISCAADPTSISFIISHPLVGLG